MESQFVFGCDEYSAAGMLLPPYRHPGCFELLYVLRGTVAVSTAMCTFSAGAGDFFFMTPDMVRSAAALSENAVLRSIWFSKQLFDDMTESIEYDLLYMFAVQSRTRENRITSASPLYVPVRRAFESCRGEYLSKDLCYSLRLRGQIMLMMAQILASYGATRENDRAIYHNVLRLRPVLDYIDEHYREKISVPQLAELLCVTPDYFTKLFRDSIGKTTVDYINSVRINRSMILLLESDMPVAQIAAEIGLVSGNYFSKLFRKVTGKTPLAFRRLTAAAGRRAPEAAG